MGRVGFRLKLVRVKVSLRVRVRTCDGHRAMVTDVICHILLSLFLDRIATDRHGLGDWSRVREVAMTCLG